MQALHLYAGPLARQMLAQDGLQPQDVSTMAGAAGGPKGLILGALDRFLFGDWLARAQQPVHLVGASIGAWRMAAACLQQPVAALQRLESDYIHQHYELAPGQKRIAARDVSASFGQNLRAFYDGRVDEVLHNPRYRLHIITSRGRHLLRREHGLRTPLGYLGAYLSNSVRRKALGAWLERVVFSAPLASGASTPLPFAVDDFRTRQVGLSCGNFYQALQASCSIPFVLQAVHDIPGAPPGAYWDGGITDYHLHLHYKTPELIANNQAPMKLEGQKGLVLYPHFQRAVVPGWLDKKLPWRHHATPYLDRMLLLAPNPDWVASLPNAKLPDRSDFAHYGNDLAARVKAWSSACSASEQLAAEFAQWLERPDMARVLPL